MKFVLSLILVVACLLAAKSILVSPDDKLVPVTEAEQVVAVTAHDWGRSSGGKTKLVVAVWADGTIIWSQNRITGGAPYLSGKIDPTSCSSLLKRLDSDGYFSRESFSNAQFGPDSKFTSILVKNKKQKLDMRSWHELYEMSGKVVCTSDGITALDGKRLDAIAVDKKEYVHYRLAWAELRLMINQLVPADGQSVNGEIHMEHGVMSWKPDSK